MFTHLIVIKPLGFLYGSCGPFLSPENLVGRSGNSFPPSSATVSGLYAAKYSQPQQDNPEEDQHWLELPELVIAGPFWAENENVQNFYVPTPFNYLVEELKKTKNTVTDEGKIQQKLRWNNQENQWLPSVTGKFVSQSWIAIEDWRNPKKVKGNPWQYVPHLHPRLEKNQRKVDLEQRGSLFLENAVQMHPETCLVYLTNTEIEEGWYRFGGESHLVELECLPINNQTVLELLAQQVGDYFALITPAIWGSNRFSFRVPMWQESNNSENQGKPVPEWENSQMITERPHPFRYRLGGKGKTKRLSRGRYAVPSGTVYALEKPLLQSWFQWQDDWFPKEGYSFKRWGCGLALPLEQN